MYWFEAYKHRIIYAYKKIAFLDFFFLNSHAFIYIYKKFLLIQMPHDTPKFFLWCSDDTARLTQQPCTVEIRTFLHYVRN